MRFIHLADVHLGAVPDRGCPWSEKRREEIWETFRRIIAGIRENPVDLLFITGDLFHHQPLVQDLKEVNSLFASVPETRIYLMAGERDYMRDDSAYRTFQWAPNVTFFKEERLTCVKDEKLDVYVYGLSYEHREIREALYDKAAPKEGEGIHILVAHGGDHEHIPVNVKALSAAGFDYIALGHMHTPQIILRDTAACAGALEPIDRNDLGPHGYMEGRTENGRLRVRFVPFACRSYEQLLINLNESDTQTSLEETLKEELYKNGVLNIYRVILQGCRAPEVLLIPEKLKNCGYITEVLDESHPAYDLEELEKKYKGTFIGSYLEQFMKKERNMVMEKAMYYGLQALLETSTISVVQLKNVTGQELSRGLQNSVTSTQETADSAVNLSRAVQMLKMSRKGFQVEKEKKQKEAEKEQEKLTINMKYLRQEMDELIDRQSEVDDREISLKLKGTEVGNDVILDEKIEAARKKKSTLTTGVVTLTAASAMLLVGGGAIFQEGSVVQTVLEAALILAAVLMFVYRGRSDKEAKKWKKLKSRLHQKQEKLKWDRENLKESYREKEIAYSNLEEESRDYEQQISLPTNEDRELQALDLALEVIQKVSVS